MSKFYYNSETNDVYLEDKLTIEEIKKCCQTFKITDENLRTYLDLEDKLRNMVESEITEEVYNFITSGDARMQQLEDKLVEIYPKFLSVYNIAYDCQLFNCDAFYMTAINMVFKNEIVPAKCGYDMIKMKYEN